MNERGDKATRRQGDKGTARAPRSAPPRPPFSRSCRPSVAASPCLLASPVLRPLAPLPPCPLASSPRPPVPSPHARPRTAAFTLPEVLATLVLIGLVMPAVMKGVSLAMAASDDARKRIEAVGLAENKLAELYADATSSQGAAAGGSGDFGDLAPGYRWESTTASVDTNLTEIGVRVTWTARGAERGVTLSTYAYGGASATSTGSATAGPGGTP
jgi:prepilin-type N-terminal cleavage/methylation domain-containing protein